jgi:hypothetical protein
MENSPFAVQLEFLSFEELVEWSKKEPEAFFHTAGNFWFWPGHGNMIKGKLLVF